MALAREDIDFENIKRDAKIEVVLNYVISQEVEIAHLKDEQFEMRNEIERRDEIISKLEDNARKDKRWNMLWRNSLEGDMAETQVFLAIAFLINILFTYFMSR
jgi:hypothetical protein